MGTLSSIGAITTDGLAASMADPHLVLLAVLVGMWGLDRLFGALGTGRTPASGPGGSTDATEPTSSPGEPNRHAGADPGPRSGAE